MVEVIVFLLSALVLVALLTCWLVARRYYAEHAEDFKAGRTASKPGAGKGVIDFIGYYLVLALFGSRN